MTKSLLLLSIFLIQISAIAQSPINEKIQNFRKANEVNLLEEYINLVSIPNVVNDTIGIQKTAKFIASMMEKRGIQPQFLDGKTKGVPPAIYGEILTPNATKTIIFYAHYDGQPVNPNQWAEGLKPYQAIFMDAALDKGGKKITNPKSGETINPEWRIYGRSTSDDKGGIFAILNGYNAMVQSGIKPSINIKFFFEGEEEAGSIHLPEILEKHKDKLKSDLWIICDGPVHQTGLKQVVFGVRGDVNMDIRVYGPKRPLHSGHYGNWIPNPAMKLVHLLSTMKDTKGKVLIKGFYDDVVPLSPTEKKAIAAVPSVEKQMQEELGVAKPEGTGESLIERISLPSLNINGIQSANVGKLAANVIPTVAIAALDLRLVLGNDQARQVQKVVNHIKNQGYYVIEDREPTDEERLKYANIARVSGKVGGYNAQRTKMDLPIAQDVIKAVQTTQKEPVVLLPSGGGSLPLYMFEQILNAKTITVGIANHDNNQHAENENIRVQNLWNGIETYSALMMMK
ncbi:MAG: M20/M25/M40 family metallo-hydrolase [Bacteroidota bacterium]|jgi:acetylornithine deacetylase/succinyl-diaminopimelate desuccinylase-like protein